MKRNKLLLALLLIFQIGFSQEEKLIKGKIIISDATPGGVIILNLVNEKETVSDAKGEFTILAKVDDVLVFHAPNLDYQRKIIEAEDYNSGKISMKMTSKIEVLEEVEIRNDINALSLGILSKPAKKYTTAERRLYTATCGGPIDLLLNTISGRKKSLENGLETERKEKLLQKLDGLYKDDFYKEKLNIEKEYIKPFHYFAVEDKKFSEAVNEKNMFMTMLLIFELAGKFNEINGYGKK